jgi:2,3-bisphosphoglycerate-independent phosphoglycerate mutase
MLKKLSNAPSYAGPIVTIVLDGVGITPRVEGNAVAQANMPTLQRLFRDYPNRILKAHGKAVGLPSDDDMGNSEVGHNAIGSGQIVNQGASLVNQAIASGKIFERDAWKEISTNVRNHNSTLHFIGLFSDGNVHSHIDHLKALILQAKKEGVRKVRLHILLDGRDVGETSALDYVIPFEKFLSEINGGDFDARIASGGGRMFLTMDRYEADWSMVERGWKIHVHGEGRHFASAEEAIRTFRDEIPGVGDQNLPGFVIAEHGNAVGPVLDDDSVVFFNFRGDRAIEISKAFEQLDFKPFDRTSSAGRKAPKVTYAGMLEYDGDEHIPARYLVPPPEIRDTMSELQIATGISQLAISETQKYGHVTYFWNGNRSGKFDDKLETWIEIPSDRVSFDERPWMKAAEITDALIEELKTGRHRTARVNYANGDMVGHTGSLRAATMAMEAVDISLARLLPVIDALGGMAIITADHGNADEMYEIDKKSGQPVTDKTGRIKPKTSHTLNPVPCIFYDNVHGGKYSLVDNPAAGLSNLAATTTNLLGFAAPEQWDASLIKF